MLRLQPLGVNTLGEKCLCYPNIFCKELIMFLLRGADECFIWRVHKQRQCTFCDKYQIDKIHLNFISPPNIDLIIHQSINLYTLKLSVGVRGLLSGDLYQPCPLPIKDLINYPLIRQCTLELSVGVRGLLQGISTKPCHLII